MANPHHRKKHKQHLQNFKHQVERKNAGITKQKSAVVLMIIGAVVGLAIGYMSSSGHLVWMAVGAVVFGTVGYFVGKKVDK